MTTPSPDSSSTANTAQPTPDAWGQPITPKRQAELQDILNAWNAPDADRGERKGPFDVGGWSYDSEGRIRLHLTGADVFWLAEQSGRDLFEGVPNLHLETLYVNSE
jgi:hypothetical protein